MRQSYDNRFVLPRESFSTSKVVRVQSGAIQEGSESPPLPAQRAVWSVAFSFIGVLLCITGFATYFAGILFAVLRLVLTLKQPLRAWNEAAVWYSGVPVTIGLGLLALDLTLMLPEKRRRLRRSVLEPTGDRRVVAVLTAYNDDLSIAEAVADFQSHPLVERVIVVDNNSKDRTSERASGAGATVIMETRQGYGRCVYRCFQEALERSSVELIDCARAI